MLCIPKIVTAKLRKAFETGKIDVDEFLKASETDKALMIEQYVGKEYSGNISKRFANRYRVDLTPEEVGQISKQLKQVDELKMREGDLSYEDWVKLRQEGKPAPEWARKYVELADYTREIITQENTLGLFGSTRKALKESAERIKNVDGVGQKAVQLGREVFNTVTSPVLKSLKASMDASYAFRQGLRVLIQSRGTYKDSITQSFKQWAKIASKKEQDAIMREFRATYLAHPRYKDLVVDGKLGFGVVEEFFPTSIAEEIPALGNIFKASNNSFTVFSQSARFGLADDLYNKQLILNDGAQLSKEQLQSIGELANTWTGRGNLGKLEANAELINKVLFSGRYIKSTTDIFTKPFDQSLTPFAREEAMKHSLSVLGTIGALAGTASLFTDVEFDPRSSNFLKAKVSKDKWVDLSAGTGQYITLMARTATQETKTNKGKVQKLNEQKYGARSVADVWKNFAVNKLAPGPGTLYRAIGEGEYFGDEEVNIVNTAKNLAMPITAENAIEYFQDEDMATAFMLWISETFGASIADRKP